jgi:hypothetical protein
MVGYDIIYYCFMVGYDIIYYCFMVGYDIIYYCFMVGYDIIYFDIILMLLWLLMMTFTWMSKFFPTFTLTFGVCKLFIIVFIIFSMLLIIFYIMLFIKYLNNLHFTNYYWYFTLYEQLLIFYTLWTTDILYFMNYW